MAKTYQCQTCQREFNRVSSLKRHERCVHGLNQRLHICKECGQNFKRPDSLQRHQKLHRIERNEKMKSIQSTAEPVETSTKRQHEECNDTSSVPKKSKMENHAGNKNDILLKHIDDPQLLQIYKTNWRQIKTYIKKGKILTKYNCYLPNLSTDSMVKCAEEVFEKQRNAFKMNIAFGFILRNNETNERRFYYSSGNTKLFPAPHLITDCHSFEAFISTLKQIDPLDYAREKRPNSKWIVEEITNITFFAYKIRDHPIGTHCILPEYITQNQSVIALNNKQNGEPYKDNLCFFRCLALHFGEQTKSLETRTKSLYREHINHPIKDFKGVALDQLPGLEDRFKVNIAVYELTEQESEQSTNTKDSEPEEIKEAPEKKMVARLIHRSLEKHSATMHLNVHSSGSQRHFSHITDTERYCKSYSCRKCQKLWKTAKQLHRHEVTCECKGTVDVFPCGIYVSPPSVLDQIREEGIEIPAEWDYFPHFATFDFECYMVKSSAESGGEKLTWTRDHIPLSVSVCSNVPGYTEPTCFVSRGNPNEIVQSMVQYLVEISLNSYEKLQDIFGSIFVQLNEQIQKLHGEEKCKVKLNYLGNLRSKLEAHFHQLPVMGFNSGKYDINLVKRYLLPYLVENEPVNHLVKRNNNYMSIVTDHVKFLDVTNFLAPGFSLDQFIRAYDCSLQKGLFPYEWIHLDNLDHTSLPPREAFDSKLKGTSITEDEYQACQEVWDREGMQTMRDYLIWYNNRDVQPFVEAVEKMADTYREKEIDVFKDGISVPGLTMKYLFKISPRAHFALFGNKDQDLYHTFRNNLVGGPSIVFTRYHETGKTQIRGGKGVQKIVGYDANALYLSALKQDMPTGYPTRRKEATGFKKEPKPFSVVAQEWLEWEAYRRGISIRHEGNNKEKRVGPRMLPVDGFSAEINTVFEMQGCWYHGHPCKMNPRHEEESMQKRYQKTLEKKKYIESLGYTFIEMWECEFNLLKKDNQILQQFLQSSKRPLDYKVTLSMTEIIDAIKSGQLFGCVECDVCVPDHLKFHFSEMTPIFKNTEISQKDIGPFMQSYAVEHGIMNTPRRSLIGSMFGEKMLFATPLLQWYLSEGLEITRVYEVAEYTPVACFSKFVDSVSDARRVGDSDPSKAIIADTMKLMGNSSYGKTITNKYRHRNIKITDSAQASNLVNEPLFRDLNDISDNCYEVEMSKAKIKHDLPIQIGFFVYQHAKLRMLQFYFNFLNFYLDRSDFEYVQMDTDSAYFAISGDSIESLVKPELREQFEREKHKWLPRTDTVEHARYDKRTPGLFKLEWEGDGIVALCSKTWYGFGSKDKFSSKGANKKNNIINKEKYLRVLIEQKAESATNRGFRVKDNMVLTYEQVKDAFTYFYPKRKVLADGITTTYLDI